MSINSSSGPLDPRSHEPVYPSHHRLLYSGWQCRKAAISRVDLYQFQWPRHCRGLFRLPLSVSNNSPHTGPVCLILWGALRLCPNSFGLVSLTKRLPGQRTQQQTGANEEPAADNEVVRAMEFEQKRLANGQGMESPRNPPGCQLSPRPVAEQRDEWVVVGDSDPKFHDSTKVWVPP